MNQDFLDLLRALSEEHAKFLVVGAYAVSFHSEPRATGDLDLWVEPETTNAQRVYQALAKFGAPLDDLSVADLCSENLVFQIGVPPRRIDILTSITGVTFSQAWPSRIAGHYGGVPFFLIGIKELIINKQALGRPKDLLDLDALKRLGKP